MAELGSCLQGLDREMGADCGRWGDVESDWGRDRGRLGEMGQTTGDEGHRVRLGEREGQTGEMADWGRWQIGEDGSRLREIGDTDWGEMGQIGEMADWGRWGQIGGDEGHGVRFGER